MEVNFDLPSGFEAFQAPNTIPTIFNGDKIVIYGILKSMAASDDPLQSGVSGKASLKGHISGNMITHMIPFDIPAPPLKGEDEVQSSTGFDMPVVHQLAAKSLLSDWAAGKGWGSTSLTHEREQESTNLSIESSVISEYTAFVAVDEEQNQPIEGAITLCDVTATMAPQQEGVANMPVLCGAAAPRRMMMRCSAPIRNSSASSPPLVPCAAMSLGAPPPPGGAPSFASSLLQKDADVLLIKGRSSAPQYLSRDAPSAPPPAPGGAQSFVEGSRVKVEDGLTVLISLQHATGYWLLGNLCDKFLHKTEAQTTCPPNLSKEVWATVIALLCLESRYAQQKDEWELVAMKAEMWLSSQSLPQGLSIKSLREIAVTVI